MLEEVQWRCNQILLQNAATAMTNLIREISREVRSEVGGCSVAIDDGHCLNMVPILRLFPPHRDSTEPVMYLSKQFYQKIDPSLFTTV